MKTSFLTRKKALLIVFMAAALLLVFIFLRFGNDKPHDLRTTEGRQMFLQELGWEINPDSESHKTVLIPKELSGVMVEYNKMQLKQGFDLTKHPGETCEQYIYTLTNYPGSDQTVLVTLYIQGKELVAADIHSTAMNGFMHGIIRSEQKKAEG